MANRISSEFKLDTREAARRLTDIERGATDAGEALDDAGTKGKVMAQILGQAAAAVEADLADARRMAESLGQALGPELTAKLNTNGQLLGIVDDLRKVGLTADDVEADIDQLAASIRRLDDSAESVRSFNAEMGRVRTAQDRVTEGANMNRSVMANFAGNTAQELPLVTNAFGPLNMAISQAVEYAAEGNIAMKQMVGAGLGMAGVGLAVSLVTNAIATHKKNAEQAKDRTDLWVQSLRDGADVLDQIAEKGKVEAFSFGSTRDLTAQIDRLGMTAEQFFTLVQGGQPALDAWVAEMERFGMEVVPNNSTRLDELSSLNRDFLMVLRGVESGQKEYADAQELAAIQARVFGTETQGATKWVNELSPALRDAVEAHQDEAAAAQEAFETSKRLTDEYNDQRDAINDLIGEKAALVGGDIAVREAQRDAKAAADELAASIDSGTMSFGEFGVALDETVASQIAAAQTAATYAADQLRATGNMVDAKTETYLYKTALQDLANEATGPLKAALEALIVQLDEAARPRTSTISVEVRGGSGVTGLTIGGGGGNQTVRSVSADGNYNTPAGPGLINDGSGPEIVELPGGAKVMTAANTRNYLRQAGRSVEQPVALHVHHHHNRMVVVGTANEVAGAMSRRVRGRL